MAKSKYEGTYNFRGVDVPLTVDFTANVVRQYNKDGIKDQVSCYGLFFYP